MTPKLDERAEQAQKALFESYDQLNALWLKVEEKLTSRHIPRPVYFAYFVTEDEYDQPEDAYCLGLQKVKGSWRICHGVDWVRTDHPIDWMPITECSAETRTTAAKHLEKFEEKIVQSAETFLPEVEKAKEQLQAFLNPCLPSLLAERAKLNGKAK